MYNPSEIENFEMLSSYLRTTPEQLDKFVNGEQYIIDWKDTSSLAKIPNYKDNSYRTDFQRFYIPKKNKRLGHRIVYKCYQQFTKDILKILKFNLTNIYIPHNCVHGFVPGKNTRSNALVHLGKKNLLSLDIKNFFESINKESVNSALISLGFNESIASDLSSICTLEDKLVQGFPTSPILANIVCSEMDQKIQELCQNYDATYTRYADDLSISSNDIMPQIDEIDSILKSFQFELNTSKTKRFKRGQNQYVTGLSISDSLYPRIPKPIKRRLRQQLYYIKKYGYHSHICRLNNLDETTNSSHTNEFIKVTRNNLKGWIDYISSIEPQLAKRMYASFNEIEKIRYSELMSFFKENKGVLFMDYKSSLKNDK
ncbi:reverse transcriptase family protein [Flavobacterium sp.]|uniref:reverse transcriptase family protein n=1 Tax=Flavobacterium sp. TaxID=239 RepID=UPI002634D564|nr:reverse transcriptase family protein [Flavobacterium sp.]